MNSLLISMLLACTLFFSLLSVGLILLIVRRNKKRMQAIFSMVTKAKASWAKRDAQLQNIPQLADDNPELIDKLKKKEMYVYNYLTTILSDPQLTAVDSIPLYLDVLLSPYFEIISHLAENSGGASLAEMEALEARYKEKIAENEVTAEKLSNITTEKNNVTESLVKSKDLLQLIITDIAKMTEEDLDTDKFNDLDTTEKQYNYLQIKLEDKLLAFDAEDDDFDQNAALIEQLRFEKLEGSKKYRKAMDALTDIYTKYASAFGLELPEGNNLDIAEFEKIIEKNAAKE